MRWERKGVDKEGGMGRVGRGGREKGLIRRKTWEGWERERVIRRETWERWDRKEGVKEGDRGRYIGG